MAGWVAQQLQTGTTISGGITNALVVARVTYPNPLGIFPRHGSPQPSLTLGAASHNPAADDIGTRRTARFGWEAQQAELRSIAEYAASLKLRTVVGAVHRLTAPHRPHNNLYVIDNHGRVVTRYDERMLSNAKVSYMYTAGSSPITFDVDGVRFGCALSMESVYPELFLARAGGSAVS
ncbi:MAG TPA: hypothetical protein VK284_13915 [Streptosporangiaceae bacterium]|nr:hypothetical protein [Streptosporangiaceae bacterium]HLN70072.1 hypothetical protein [Streptosporangiaceae bacterium]